MTPEEAESIFYEFGDALSNQWLATPDKFGPNLVRTSRAELRTAILMWVAKQKFEGVDILYRRELPNGQRAAVLELAQNLWPFTSMFGAIKNGTVVLESREESRDASRRHDIFVEFLKTVDAEDSHYWKKIRAKLE